MIEIIKELKIEVSKPNIFQAIVAKQYDMNTRFIKATLVDGSDVIYIPNDPDRSVKVVINAERPDGQSKGFDGEVNDDGTVTVPLHSWMLELEGTVICDISVIDTEADDNKKLTTTSFTLLVEKAAYGGGDVTNDPQYDVLVTLLETCQDASAAAEEALNKSNEALEKSASADAKYDACVEATENANNVLQDIKKGGYIESLKELNVGEKFTVWVGTQAEYEALAEHIPNCLYLIEDDDSLEASITKSLMKVMDDGFNIDNLKENGKFAVFNATGTLPSGYSSDDNNLFIENYMWFEHYGRQFLHDVRTNKTYSRNLFNDEWQPFEFVDTLVEQGIKTVDGVTWTYEKWASGKVECFCSLVYAAKFSSVGVSPIVTAQIFENKPLPFEFVEMPCIHTTLTGAIGSHQWVGNVVYNHSDKKIRWINLFSYTEGNLEGELYIHLTGKWK